MYQYVPNSTGWIDPLGLMGIKCRAKLTATANVPDHKDPRFTKAGRSLTKHGHGQRPGNTSKIPAPKGNPTQINAQAAALVNDIVFDPAASFKTRVQAKGDRIWQVARPDGVGAIYKKDKSTGCLEFSYFAENLS